MSGAKKKVLANKSVKEDIKDTKKGLALQLVPELVDKKLIKSGVHNPNFLLAGALYIPKDIIQIVNGNEVGIPGTSIPPQQEDRKDSQLRKSQDEQNVEIEDPELRKYVQKIIRYSKYDPINAVTTLRDASFRIKNRARGFARRTQSSSAIAHMSYRAAIEINTQDASSEDDIAVLFPESDSLETTAAMKLGDDECGSFEMNNKRQNQSFLKWSFSKIFSPKYSSTKIDKNKKEFFLSTPFSSFSKKSSSKKNVKKLDIDRKISSKNLETDQVPGIISGSLAGSTQENVNTFIKQISKDNFISDKIKYLRKVLKNISCNVKNNEIVLNTISSKSSKLLDCYGLRFDDTEFYPDCYQGMIIKKENCTSNMLSLEELLNYLTFPRLRNHQVFTTMLFRHEEVASNIYIDKNKINNSKFKLRKVRKKLKKLKGLSNTDLELAIPQSPYSFGDHLARSGNIFKEIYQISKNPKVYLSTVSPRRNTFQIQEARVPYTGRYPVEVVADTYVNVLEPPVHDPKCSLQIVGEGYKGKFNIGLDPIIDQVIYNSIQNIKETCEKSDKIYNSKKYKKLAKKRSSFLCTIAEGIKTLIGCKPARCPIAPKTKAETPKDQSATQMKHRKGVKKQRQESSIISDEKDYKILYNSEEFKNKRSSKLSRGVISNVSDTQSQDSFEDSRIIRRTFPKSSDAQNKQPSVHVDPKERNEMFSAIAEKELNPERLERPTPEVERRKSASSAGRPSSIQRRTAVEEEVAKSQNGSIREIPSSMQRQIEETGVAKEERRLTSTGGPGTIPGRLADVEDTKSKHDSNIEPTRLEQEPSLIGVDTSRGSHSTTSRTSERSEISPGEFKEQQQIKSVPDEIAETLQDNPDRISTKLSSSKRTRSIKDQPIIERVSGRKITDGLDRQSIHSNKEERNQLDMTPPPKRSRYENHEPEITYVPQYSEHTRMRSVYDTAPRRSSASRPRPGYTDDGYEYVQCPWSGCSCPLEMKNTRYPVIRSIERDRNVKRKKQICYWSDNKCSCDPHDDYQDKVITNQRISRPNLMPLSPPTVDFAQDATPLTEVKDVGVMKTQMDQKDNLTMTEKPLRTELWTQTNSNDVIPKVEKVTKEQRTVSTDPPSNEMLNRKLQETYQAREEEITVGEGCTKICVCCNSKDPTQRKKAWLELMDVIKCKLEIEERNKMLYETEQQTSDVKIRTAQMIERSSSPGPKNFESEDEDGVPTQTSNKELLCRSPCFCTQVNVRKQDRGSQNSRVALVDSNKFVCSKPCLCNEGDRLGPATYRQVVSEEEFRSPTSFENVRVTKISQVPKSDDSVRASKLLPAHNTDENIRFSRLTRVVEGYQDEATDTNFDKIESDQITKKPLILADDTKTSSSDVSDIPRDKTNIKEYKRSTRKSSGKNDYEIDIPPEKTSVRDSKRTTRNSEKISAGNDDLELEIPPEKASFRESKKSTRKSERKYDSELDIPAEEKRSLRESIKSTNKSEKIYDSQLDIPPEKRSRRESEVSEKYEDFDLEIPPEKASLKESEKNYDSVLENPPKKTSVRESKIETRKTTKDNLESDIKDRISEKSGLFRGKSVFSKKKSGSSRGTVFSKHSRKSSEMPSRLPGHPDSSEDEEETLRRERLRSNRFEADRYGSRNSNQSVKSRKSDVIPEVRMTKSSVKSRQSLGRQSAVPSRRGESLRVPSDERGRSSANTRDPVTSAKYSTKISQNQKYSRAESIKKDEDKEKKTSIDSNKRPSRKETNVNYTVEQMGLAYDSNLSSMLGMSSLYDRSSNEYQTSPQSGSTIGYEYGKDNYNYYYSDSYQFSDLWKETDDSFTDVRDIIPSHDDNAEGISKMYKYLTKPEKIRSRDVEESTRKNVSVVFKRSSTDIFPGERSSLQKAKKKVSIVSGNINDDECQKTVVKRPSLRQGLKNDTKRRSRVFRTVHGTIYSDRNVRKSQHAKKREVPKWR